MRIRNRCSSLVGIFPLIWPDCRYVTRARARPYRAIADFAAFHWDNLNRLTKAFPPVIEQTNTTAYSMQPQPQPQHLTCPVLYSTCMTRESGRAQCIASQMIRHDFTFICVCIFFSLLQLLSVLTGRDDNRTAASEEVRKWRISSANIICFGIRLLPFH